MSNINLEGIVGKSYLSKFNDTEFVIFVLYVDEYDPNDDCAMARSVRVEVIPSDLNMPNFIDAYKRSAEKYATENKTELHDSNGRICNGFVGQFLHLAIKEQENKTGQYHYRNYYPDPSERFIKDNKPAYRYECQKVPEKLVKNNGPKKSLGMHVK